MISVNLNGGNCRLEIEKDGVVDEQVTIRIFNGFCMQFVSNLLDLSLLEIIEDQDGYVSTLYVNGVGGFALNDRSDASVIKEFIKENAQ